MILSHLPSPVRGAWAALSLTVCTPVLTLAMLPAALVKLVIRHHAVQRACDRWSIGLATAWVASNNAWIDAVRPSGVADWEVQGLEGLNPGGWYLVSPNHRSWVDIVVLQRIFHRRIPFLKFFLKAELIWVPVIGVAWWALDFPFMKRGRGSGSRSADLAATQAACEKFKRIPTSVINFVEGTRFTPAKHAEAKSPYKHLLKPKIGGLGVALATMGERFDALLDVTIAYPSGTPRFWDFMCGRVHPIRVHVQARTIPLEVRDGDPVADRAYRRRLQGWIDAQWQDKDQRLDAMLEQGVQ